MATVDGSGTLVNAYTYDVYGKTASASGSQANDFQFAGQQTDATGLQYLRARYYDPATGSFLGRDPLAKDASWTGQPFGYAGANPANNVDPTGLICLGKLCLDKDTPIIGKHLPGADPLTNLTDLGALVGAVTWASCAAGVYPVCAAGGVAYVAIWWASRDQLQRDLASGAIGKRESVCRNFTVQVPFPLPWWLAPAPGLTCSIIGAFDKPNAGEYSNTR
jgi:RHS repeat-associated protein